ncbi:MAG: iron-sulfur cluster assembly accessory protein [Chloroflexi bacterium]|nr:iron-sulfur cluster assembly accessory protein [Chloroflexota bacterium]
MTTTSPIEVTPLAAQKLAEALTENGEGGSMLRVMVMPNAQGNFQYVLGGEDEVKEDDQIIETDNVRVLVDADSLPLLQGAQIDYVEGLMRSGFVISNPNAPQGGGGCGSGGCGCGGGGGGGCGGGGGGGGGCACGGH